MHLDDAYIDKLNRLGKAGKPFLFIIDFEEAAPLVFPMNEIPASIRFQVPGYSAGDHTTGRSQAFHLKKQPMRYEDYLTSFNKVMQHLKHGNSYLVNLTSGTPVETDLTLGEIYELSEAPYKLLMMNQLVVFSPEPFIRIKNGMISSFPMKGTIDASVPDAARIVMEDPKESAEHITIVDLIRNDLSKVADQVQVKRYRYTERIRTHDKDILQVSSEITGRLPTGFGGRIGNILNALLPAGSISGAPKQSTIRIIREAEAQPRGYYTGIFGIFDGQQMESGVMIRFIEQTASGMLYRSGGGITNLSDPVSEYGEMIDKVYLPIMRDAEEA